MKARKESKKVKKLRSSLRRAGIAKEPLCLQIASLQRQLAKESRRREDAEAALKANESEPGYAVIRIGKKMHGPGERLVLSLEVSTFELVYSLRGRRQPVEMMREISYYCRMLVGKMEQGLVDYFDKHGI